MQLSLFMRLETHRMMVFALLECALLDGLRAFELPALFSDDLYMRIV